MDLEILKPGKFNAYYFSKTHLFFSFAINDGESALQQKATIR
jgi:hypothetical protein